MSGVDPEAVLLPQPVGVPTGIQSQGSGPYWDGCRVGELRYQRCDVCGGANLRPAPTCMACGARAMSWCRSAGQGALYSWTVVWRPQHPAFRVPYAPAIVLLDEGFYLLSAVVGCSPDALCDGLRLGVEFHPANDDVTLPYFRPLGAPDA